MLGIMGCLRVAHWVALQGLATRVVFRGMPQLSRLLFHENNNETIYNQIEHQTHTQWIENNKNIAAKKEVLWFASI